MSTRLSWQLHLHRFFPSSHLMQNSAEDCMNFFTHTQMLGKLGDEESCTSFSSIFNGKDFFYLRFKSYPLGLFILFLALNCYGAPEVIRFSVTDAWSQPFGEFDGDELKSGIMKDIILEMASEARFSPKIIKIPRKRIDEAVDLGKIDVRCYINKDWLSDPEKYFWSEPIFTMGELIVHRKERPAPTSLQALNGKVIGTILGYKKYAFDDLVSSGALSLSVAPSAEHLKRMLIGNRIEYAAMNSITYYYYMKDPEFSKVMGNSPLMTSKSAIRCAFPKNGAVPISTLISATESMKKSGKIDLILSKYR